MWAALQVENRARRGRKQLLRLLSAVALLALPRPGAADPSQVYSVAWVRGEGAESCPASPLLAAAVAARLKTPQPTGALQRTLEATVQRSGQRWTAQLTIRGGAGSHLGQRQLTVTSADCDAIFSATSLALALAIEPDVSLEEAVPVQPQAPSNAPPLAQPPPSSMPPAAADTFAGTGELCGACPVAQCPRWVCPTCEQKPTAALASAEGACPTQAPARWQVGWALGALAAWELLPRLGAGARVAFTARSEQLEARVAALYLPVQRAGTVEPALGVGLTAFELGLGARVVGSPTWRASAAVGVLVGASHVVVLDALAVDTGERLWLAAQAGPVLAWSPASWLNLEASVQAVIPLVSNELYLVGDSRPSYTPRLVGGLVGMSAGLQFP